MTGVGVGGNQPVFFPRIKGTVRCLMNGILALEHVFVPLAAAAAESEQTCVHGGELVG